MMVTVDDVTVDDAVDDVTVDVVPGGMFLWVLLNLVRLPVSLLKGPPPNHIAIRIDCPGLCILPLCRLRFRVLWAGAGGGRHPKENLKRGMRRPLWQPAPSQRKVNQV